MCSCDSVQKTATEALFFRCDHIASAFVFTSKHSNAITRHCQIVMKLVRQNVRVQCWIRICIFDSKHTCADSWPTSMSKSIELDSPHCFQSTFELGEQIHKFSDGRVLCEAWKINSNDKFLCLIVPVLEGQASQDDSLHLELVSSIAESSSSPHCSVQQLLNPVIHHFVCNFPVSLLPSSCNAQGKLLLHCGMFLLSSDVTHVPSDHLALFDRVWF